MLSDLSEKLNQCGFEIDQSRQVPTNQSGNQQSDYLHQLIVMNRSDLDHEKFINSLSFSLYTEQLTEKGTDRRFDVNSVKFIIFWR